MVKADSTVARTAIQLGTRDSSHVEVVQGLEAGAVVVRAGHQKLFDGARVVPILTGDDGAAPAATGASEGATPGKAPASGTRTTATAGATR